MASVQGQMNNMNSLGLVVYRKMDLVLAKNEKKA